MSKLTKKIQWDNFWSKYKLKTIGKKYLFFDILTKFLKISKLKSVLEIGCIPGNFLIAFKNNFHYKIYGLDYSHKFDKLKENLEKNNILDFTFYNQDFLKFKTNKKWDVVCSFGFIEHFKNYEAIFNKHLACLKKDGHLIIGLPNFRYFQYVFHKCFDKENLKIHNLKIMDLEVLRELCKKQNLKVKYLNYYKTIDLWVEKMPKNPFFKMIILFLIVIGKMINKLINFPNKFFSPYIILIAKNQK